MHEKKDVYSAIFINIIKTFNNIYYNKLQHNLKKEKVLKFIIN